MGRLRLIYCRDCGAKLDAFGICPNASAKDAAISHGTVQCGEGRYSTPLKVWSVLAACASNDQAKNIGEEQYTTPLEVWSMLSACASNDPAMNALPETRVSTARSGPPRSIAA